MDFLTPLQPCLRKLLIPRKHSICTAFKGSFKGLPAERLLSWICTIYNFKHIVGFMFCSPESHGKRSNWDFYFFQHLSEEVLKWTCDCFCLQVSMTGRASSTASSASWLCLLPAVRAAASPSWKTTSQLSTLSGTRSASSVGWVFPPLYVSQRSTVATMADFV